jgi:hypothetical protein
MRRTTFRLSNLLGCLALIVFFTAIGNAQFRASVQGVVTDNAGGVVPGATITLTNKETNQTQTTQSSEEGNYSFLALPPGLYSVSAEKEGFKKRIVDDVKVDAEAARGQDIQLEAGVISEIVTVQADQAPLETEDANVRKTITTQEILRLPQVGRDPYELIRLSPGVFGAGARNADGGSNGLPNTSGPGASNSGIFATENRPPISANGQRVSANSFQIDGVSVNSQTWGGAAVITPTQEAVKEVQVTSATYSAEDGRNSGAQVKVVTQNGTNQFHGSAFFKYNDPGWNAFNRGFIIPGTNRGVASTRVNVRDKTFGGSFGGPLVKNRLFFFFAYEGLRNQTNNFYESFIETPQLRQLIINQRPGSVAATILGQPGVEPRITAILPRTCADFSFPTACQTVAGGLDLGSLTGTTGQYVRVFSTEPLGGGFDGVPDLQYALLENPRRATGNQYVTRIDFDATDRDKFAFTMFWSPAEFFGADTAAQSRMMSDVVSKRRSWNVALAYIRNISSNIINEARFNMTKWGFNEVDSNPDINFGVPRIEIEGFLPGGARLRYGANRSENTPGIIGERQVDFRDLVAWVHGDHTTKFGGEYRIDYNNNTGTGGARPLYSFVRPWNFANDTPIFEAINADAEGNPQANNAAFKSGDLAFFVQNDWKLRPNLTMNLGLRWEYFQPISADQLGNLELGPNGLIDSRVVTVEKLTKSDFNDFGPQVGFAWSPRMFNDKAVLRGGFGIGYDRIPSALLANTRANPPNGARYSLCCGTAMGEFGSPFAGGQIVYALGSSNSPDSFPRHPLIGGGFNPTTGGPNLGRVEVYGIDPNAKTPRVIRYSVEGQYEMFWSMVATLAYQGSRSDNFVRIEPLHFTNPGASGSFPFSPVFFGYADVSGNYNGMNARLQRRFSQGLMFDLNYRFSKSIDTYSFEAPCACTNQTFPLDQSTELGPSDFDVRHFTTLSVLWDIPFYRSQRSWAGKLLGGWQINGILTHHTGHPWTPVINPALRSPNGNFFGPIRPVFYSGLRPLSNSDDNFISGPNGIFPDLGPTTTIPGTCIQQNNYFVLSTFPVQTNPPACNVSGGQPEFFLNVPGIGRNTFFGPKYFNIDMSFSKRFGLPSLGALGENANLDLRFNFFNIFNLRNFAPFQSQSNSTRINNASFGEPTGLLAGRVVEFQARFSF